MLKLSRLTARTTAALVLAVTATTGSAQVKVDPDLPDYEPVKGVSGNIKSVGSDTLNNLMTLWAEGFKKIYPNVQVEIEGKGSSTAPPALIAGTANFGPMSRKMKQKEEDEFESQFGYKPTPLPTSIDMLAVYVQQGQPDQGPDACPRSTPSSPRRRKLGPWPKISPAGASWD